MNETSHFTRWLLIVLGLLFTATLGMLIYIPIRFEEGMPPGMVLVTGLLLAIPTGLLYTLLGVLILAVHQHRQQGQFSLFPARLLYWSPRMGGIVMVAFMSLFALDVFEAGHTLGEMLLAFFMHMLPMLSLAGVLALAWRWPWVGAVVFGLAALFFTFRLSFDLPQSLSIFISLGAPLLLIALLFAANGRWKKEIDLARHPEMQTL